MHSGVKLIIGIIIFLIGIYWYAAPLFGHMGLQQFFGVSTFRAFVTVFAGLVGVALIVLGLIVAWIEYEDLKWESREKKEKRKKK
jgi:preprotein translocase subunit SecG